MKRSFILKFISFLTGTVLIFAGCYSGDISHDTPHHDWESYFVYPLNDVYSFDVDKNGNLYAAAFNSDILKIYDPYGAETEEKTLPTHNHVTIQVRNGDIFTLSSNEIYRNEEKIYTIDFEQAAKDFRIVGDNIYLLYFDYLADQSQAPATYSLNGWKGENLICISLSDFSVSEVKCDYPLFISATDDELWVYGMNNDGCYVAPIENGEMSEPMSVGTEPPYGGFMIVDSKGKYLSSGSAGDTSVLCMTDPETGQTNELMPNAAIFDAAGIRLRDGYIYYINQYYYAENCNKIERIRQSDYAKNNIPVKLLATEWFSYIPFGCGRSVIESRLSKEEFALTVLSLDRGYDACVLSSSQDFSKNFRDNGSFYVLNDVPGVSEYVERCFPSVREAVTDSQGNIWALPLNLNVPCALYNEVNCLAEDFSPTGGTLESLIEKTNQLFLSDTSRHDICIFANDALPLLLREELSGEINTLNQADFRNKMNFLTEKMSGELFGIDIASESNNSIVFDDGDSMLTMLAETKEKQKIFSVNGKIHAADIFEEKNPAECVFLCVNPSSDNLSATLEYITSLCGYLSSKTDDFMLDAPEMYSDSVYISELFEIYRDSEIFFRIPDELLLDSVKQYMQGELSMDELIAESERKLSAYLNE